MSNKDVIGQEVLYFDSILRIEKILDQLCDGLRTLGVFSIIKMFPELFAPLLTYTACMSAEDVAEAIYMVGNAPGDDIIMAHFKRWIYETSKECKAIQNI